jgi:hypothetical protein
MNIFDPLVSGSLSVSGSAQISGALTGTSATFSGNAILNSSSTDGSFLQLYGNNSGVQIGADKGGGAILRYNSNGNLDIIPRSGFNTIITSGNLGLGVTPSAWDLYTALQIKDSALSAINNNQVVLSQNGVYDSSANWKYINNNFASYYQQYQGQHRWHTAPSGTAGNAISFTQAMTLDASGRLGIGTTSPARTLHVLGQTGIGTVLKLEGASGTTTYLQLSYNGATNAQSGYIGYDTSANMSLFTNDTERMRITSGGNLLIGTTTDNNNKLRIGGSLSSDGLTLLNFHHGVKTLVSDATSQFAINLTTTFPNMGLVSGNVWGVIGKCTFFRFGGVEVNQFHIGRNGSGTWSVATYGASSNTASILSSVTGSGNSIFINMLSDSYVVVEITALVR